MRSGEAGAVSLSHDCAHHPCLLVNGAECPLEDVAVSSAHAFPRLSVMVITSLQGLPAQPRARHSAYGASWRDERWLASPSQSNASRQSCPRVLLTYALNRRGAHHALPHTPRDGLHFSRNTHASPAKGSTRDGRSANRRAALMLGRRCDPITAEAVLGRMGRFLRTVAAVMRGLGVGALLS